MELVTISLETAKEALKEVTKEASEVAAEGAKQVAEGAEITPPDLGKLGGKSESEHITLGKLSVEPSEVPIQFGSETEEFFCDDLALHHLTGELSDKITNAASEIKTPRQISTINEGLEGQTYPGTNVEYRRRTFMLDGEDVEGVFPRFESKFDTTLPKDLLSASDTVQFKYCTQKLAERIESAPEFAAQFTPRQIEQIKNGEPRISGLTWHHNELPGRMQLVNADVHNTCRHTGGRSIWGGGADCR
ncbi:MAG: HNH endonuclease [Roseburia sp.]|nr:HNH endonuclease [Ruminococcus flavefaciens]MCM1569141.1 HNH endonuclease [Roseburia sp.]